MNDGTTLIDVKLRYEAAHAAQYTQKNQLHALELYLGILTTHPETKEAEYSRTQIGNIVRAVVPEEEVLASHAGLALLHLRNDDSIGE